MQLDVVLQELGEVLLVLGVVQFGLVLLQLGEVQLGVVQLDVVVQTGLGEAVMVEVLQLMSRQD